MSELVMDVWLAENKADHNQVELYRLCESQLRIVGPNLISTSNEFTCKILLQVDRLDGLKGNKANLSPSNLEDS